MKFLLLFLVTGVCYATLPYSFEAESRFSAIENGNRRVLRVSHNFASNNGDSGEEIALSGSIPSDSLVLKTYQYVDGVIVSTDDNTISSKCESSEDLLAARDFTDDTANQVTNGAVTAETGAVYSSAGCTPTLVIGAGASGITSGRLVQFIEYLRVEDE